jgi:hypothetical protein
VDLLDIKGRIALALVESVFRRAGFALSPVDQREVPPHLSREDMPDFAARRPPAPAEAPEEPTRLVEVRYRLDLVHYLALENQRGPRSVFAQAKRQWPGLVFVFVTDRPAAGRSAFQAIDLGPWRAGQPLEAVDLFSHRDLAIFRQNVEDHELLLRRMFALLTGSP